MHPYAFAFSDPVNLSDPSGLDPCDELSPSCGNQGGAAGAATGLLAAGAALLDFAFGSSGNSPPNPGVLINGQRWSSVEAYVTAQMRPLQNRMEVQSGLAFAGSIVKATVWDVPVGTAKGFVALGKKIWNDPVGAFKWAVKTAVKTALCPACALHEAGRTVVNGAIQTVKGIAAGDPNAYANAIVTVASIFTGGAVAVLRGGARRLLSARRFIPGGGPKQLLPGLKISNKQFGKKVGKHAEDFGLDPSNAAHRQWVRDRIDNIVSRYDDVRQGAFNPRRGGGNDYLFYRQGADVVVTKPSGDFVTVLAGGESSVWFNGAASLLP